MKILAFPHHLEIGGSQTNAIDIATALRDDHGHDVVFFATPGPGEKLIADRGLRLLAAPRPRSSPSPSVIRALSRVIRSEGVDVVHAWDWPQCLDAFLGARVAHDVPVVGSIMSMVVTRAVPTSIPLTYGTPALLEQARAIHRGPLALLEPPINTAIDDPTIVDGLAFRADRGVTSDQLVVVVVSRLVDWLKLDGISRSIDAVDTLADTWPVRFFIVGEGRAFMELARRATVVNERHGRHVITLTDAMIDPRPAYAAADVVLGMGGSVLRGMAFGKPAIVLGEQGFAETFELGTAERFLHEGFFGTGAAAVPLRQQLGLLLDSAERRSELGAWSQALVRERFSLQHAAAQLDAFIRASAVGRPPRTRAALEGAIAVSRRLAGATLPAVVKDRIRGRGKSR